MARPIWFFRLIFVYIFSAVFPFAGSSTFPSTELNALWDLYNSTDGDNWTWKLPLYGIPWNFTQNKPNPCIQLWQGISCNLNCGTTPQSTCYVTSLILSDYHLVGTLPASLSNLTHLITLEIESNSGLTGSIPNRLFELTSLQTLYLSSNSLSSSLPTTIGSLINLISFDVSDNQLTSTLPTALSSLSSLESLYLYSNKFYGSLPSYYFTNMTALYYIDVSTNFFYGSIPESLYTIPAMEYFILQANLFEGSLPNILNTHWNVIQQFDLYHNLLMGTLPSSVCNLTTLTYISVEDNNMEGTLPDCFDQIIGFQYLFLSNNSFSGTFPTSLLSSQTFRSFVAFHNILSGTIPSDVFRIPTLIEFLVGFNHFTGSIPSEIGLSKSLIDFELNNNMLTGTIPDTIGNMLHADKIDFNTNLLTGTLPDTLTQLTQLIQFSVLVNSLTGTIPKNITNMISMTALSLNFNLFSSTLPSELFAMKSLSTLRLEDNHFYGTIPSHIDNITRCVITSLGLGDNLLSSTLPNTIITQLPYLEDIEIPDNMLTGTLPVSLGNLIQLRSIVLDSNMFIGTIPHSIGNITDLNELTINNNLLTGSIPDSIIYCKQLTTFIIRGNLLTGSIPIGIGQLTLLESFECEENYLTGTIPSTLFTGDGIHLPSLQYLYLADNLLTGYIPTDINPQSALIELNIGINLLTGNIPYNISNAKLLQVIYIMNNELTSTIPDTLYTLQDIELLYIFSNQLTGSISSNIMKLNDLGQLDCHDNLLTGSLPNNIVMLPKLNLFYANLNYFYGNLPFNNITTGISVTYELLLDENMFSGTLSSSIEHMPFLASMNLSTNYLFGSLPHTIATMKYLEVVDISYNQFTGQLVGKFSGSKHLILFFVEGNKFTGKLQDIFNLTIQHNLQFIDFSDNQLTGSLSSTFFEIQNMTTFAAVKNCLTGSIPDTICTNRFLETLALDGLHSANRCQHKLLPGFPAYALDDAISGTIPTCLYAMETLTTLHLSGNGIKGSIPDNIVISSSLTDLSLSHNELTGSIPIVIQQHKWLNIDLSFNKLNGDLISSDAPILPNTTSISLDVNRLSGRIPSHFITMKHIDILSGNLFGCTFNHRNNDLPHHDKAYNSYQCGSNSINVTTYMWIIVIGIIIVILCIIYVIRKHATTWLQYYDKMLQWLHVFDSNSNSNSNSNVLVVNSFHEDLAHIRNLCLRWTGFVISVLLPVYCILSSLYSTHSYIYGWVIALAYIGGKIPGIIMLIILFIVMISVEHEFLTLNSLFTMSTSRYVPNSVSDNNDKKIKTNREESRIRRTTLADTIASGNEPSTESGSDNGTNVAPSRLTAWSTRDTAIAIQLASNRLTFASHVNNTVAIHRPTTLIRDPSMLDMRGVSDVSMNSHWQYDKPFVMTSLYTPREDTESGVGRPNQAASKPMLERYKVLQSLKLQYTLLCLIAIVGNLIIVLAVNAAYVSSITQKFTFIQLSLITLSITMFKICWSIVILAGYICNLFQQTLNVYVESAYLNMLITQIDDEASSSPTTGTSIGNHTRVKLDEMFLFWVRIYETIISRSLIVISLFNSVIAPCLAVLLVSTECFYYVITTPSTVDASYKFIECEGFYDTLQGGFVCIGYSIVTHTTSYLPAFSYSYQCSSSLLGYFIDVYLLRYLFTGVLTPIIMVMFKRWQTKAAQNILKEKSEVKTDSFIQKYLFIFFTMFLTPSGRILDPNAVMTSNSDVAETASIANPIVNNPSLSSSGETTILAHDNKVLRELLRKSLPSDPQQSFIARRFSTLLVGDLAILITFGSIYPPLAIAICISVVLHMLTTQIGLGRFLSISNASCLREYCNVTSYVETIKRETAAVGSLIALSLAPTSGLAALFWSFFLFDIYGDEAGTRQSWWILFILPLCLGFIRICAVGKDCLMPMLQKRFNKNDQHSVYSERPKNSENKGFADGIELRQSSAIS